MSCDCGIFVVSVTSRSTTLRLPFASGFDVVLTLSTLPSPKVCVFSSVTWANCFCPFAPGLYVRTIERVAVRLSWTLSVSMSEYGWYSPSMPGTSKIFLFNVRFPDFLWLSVVRDGLAPFVVVWLLAAHDPSPDG